MLFTIITPSFNSAVTIADTLQSIAGQSYPYIEHIVVDGQSEDATADIVRSFPHVIKFISERDKGIYDAMNKGIRVASGDVIGILNSDDTYYDESIIEKVAALFNDEKVFAVYGDLTYVSQNDLNKVVRYWKAGHFTAKRFLYGWMPPHPTFFVRKEVYEKVGLFNLDLRYAADYEMMLRVLVKERFKVAYLPEVMIKMRTGGLSNATFSGRLKANKEDHKAWVLNGLKPFFFTRFLKPLRKLHQFRF